MGDNKKQNGKVKDTGKCIGWCHRFLPKINLFFVGNLSIRRISIKSNMTFPMKVLEATAGKILSVLQQMLTPKLNRHDQFKSK